jgi:hypothetical protein
MWRRWHEARRLVVIRCALSVCQLDQDIVIVWDRLKRAHELDELPYL